MEKFDLNGAPFIELNKLLKLLNWVSSGGEAKQVIKAGMVQLNSDTATEIRKKLRKGDTVAFEGQEISIV